MKKTVLRICVILCGLKFPAHWVNTKEHEAESWVRVHLVLKESARLFSNVACCFAFPLKITSENVKGILIL